MPQPCPGEALLAAGGLLSSGPFSKGLGSGRIGFASVTATAGSHGNGLFLETQAGNQLRLLPEREVGTVLAV